MNDYVTLIILMGIAGIIAAVMVVASWLIGPKRPTPYKEAPYECGVTPVGNARERFPVKFYLVAMLFIIFDIESIFLYSWYAVFNNPTFFGGNTALHNSFKVFTYVEVMVFIAFLAIGYLYVIRKGALEWDDPKALKSSVMESQSILEGDNHARSNA